MQKFTINNKEYTAVPFTFNTVCDLEDLGISIEQLGERPTNMLRAYFSLCGNMSVEEAGEEISQHIINGGDMDNLSDAMSAELGESDFFRAISQGA